MALVVHELRSKNPIVDLRVFKDRSYAVGVFLMTVLGFVLYGSLVLLPVMLQTLFGYSSLEAGQAMAPRGIGSLIMMPLVGHLTGSSTREGCSSIGPDRRRHHDAVARRAEPERRVTGTSSGRSSCRAPAWRCCSCR